LGGPTGTTTMDRPPLFKATHATDAFTILGDDESGELERDVIQEAMKRYGQSW